MWYGHTKRFPKFDRYILADKIITILFEILMIISEAEYLSLLSLKRSRLETVRPRLHSLKILIRLTHELQLIKQETYIKSEDELNEVGKMLNGWIRSLTQKPPAGGF